MKKNILLLSIMVMSFLGVAVQTEAFIDGTSIADSVSNSDWSIGSGLGEIGDDVSYESSGTGVSLEIEGCTAKQGETVDVPVVISNNTGIAGAVIKISYDSDLVLTAVNKGEAFESLAFTPPAKMTSNPVTLLWDGLEADETNGVIATLTFMVPPDITGTFQVSASYEEGGIYDGDLEDVDVEITDGYIYIPQPKINYTANPTEQITLLSPVEISGKVLAALYDDEDKLIELKIYDAAENIKHSFENSGGEYIKIMWWESLTSMKPICSVESWFIGSNEYIIN